MKMNRTAVVLLVVTIIALIAVTAIVTYFVTVETRKVPKPEENKLEALNSRNVRFNHAPGQCVTLLDDYGSEDLDILENGLVIITSGVFANMKGKLLAFNITDPGYNITEMTIEGDFNTDGYHPHGLALWRDSDTGKDMLYIVNHPATGDQIDMFEIDSDRRSLKYIRSFADPSFGFMNSLVMVDIDKFYITQMSKVNDAAVWDAETESRKGSGLLMFYDGQKAHVVESGYNMANGMNGSPDRRFIYMSEYAANKVHVYRRDPNDNVNLDMIQTVDVGTGVDNIRVDPATGDMWIGCHPNHRRLFDHIDDFNSLTPSQVLRLKMNPSGSQVVDVIEVFLDNGTTISGSTVATVHGEKLLIGSVAKEFVMCDLDCGLD